MRNLKSSIAAAMKLNQDHCGRGVSHLGGSLLAGVLIMVGSAAQAQTTTTASSAPVDESLKPKRTLALVQMLFRFLLPDTEKE